MEFILKTGISHTTIKVVGTQDLAISYGSGTVAVFATPAMIALMECAATQAIAPYLPEGYTTVGVAVNIEHNKATPLGAKVEAIAVLAKVDGKRLDLNVMAFDETGEIGKGTHTRYIVDEIKFMENLPK